MQEAYSRTELLLGSKAIEKLKNSTVAVIGVGGVGSYTAEGLARAGVGSIILVDKDEISASNINRQIHATEKTVGRQKTEVMGKRINEINSDICVTPLKIFLNSDTADSFFEGRDIDYIVDAVDTVTSKICLVVEANKRNIPIISCMGAGNKLDPTKFEVTDIYKTSVCPLAKVMRHELKVRGIKKLKVLYSKEPALKPAKSDEKMPAGKHQVPGSVSWVPSVAGLIIAGEVVKDIIGINS